MELVLYKRMFCPYCNKVLTWIEENWPESATPITVKDVRTDEGAMEELTEGGNQKMVPCLMIDGERMYESDDIIAWLDQHK